jgi:hypothetical protein
MCGKAPFISESCVSSSHEYGRFLAFMLPGVAMPFVPGDAVPSPSRDDPLRFESPQFPDYAELMRFLRVCHRCMVERDATSAEILMRDVTVPAVAKELSQHPHKLRHLLGILLSLTADDAPASFLALVRALQAAILDTGLFTRVLAGLVFLLQTSAAATGDESLLAHPDVLDPVLFYALQGLAHPDPRARAASLACLADCTSVDPVAVAAAVATSPPAFLSNTTFWEEQVQSLRLNASVAAQLEPTDPHAIASAHLIAEAISNVADLGPTRRHLCLLAALPALSAKPPASSIVLPPFVNALLAAPISAAHRLLGMPVDLPHLSPAAAGAAESLGRALIAPAAGPLARRLAEQVRADELEHLTPAHCALFAAFAHTLVGQVNAISPVWVEAFELIRDHICVSLCDPALCRDSAFFVTTLLPRLPAEQAREGVATLMSTLKLVYPSGAIECRDASISWVLTLLQADSLRQEMRRVAPHMPQQLLQDPDVADTIAEL